MGIWVCILPRFPTLSDGICSAPCLLKARNPHRWCRRHYVSKTKYIIFRTRGKTIDSNIDDILFNNNEIGTVNDVSNIFKLERVYSDNPNIDSRNYKLLGVFFDEFLSFDKHISYICAKLSKANFCIKRASNKLSLKSLKALYYALVHPHLLYCLNIISCTSAKNIARIVKLQKKLLEL